MTPAQSRFRAMAYNNIDGIGELGVGFFLGGIAAMEWVHFRAPAGSFWDKGFPAVGAFIVIVSIVHYGSKAVKNRLTYPRTGFVEYRNNARAHYLAGALAAALLAMVIGLASRRHWPPAGLAGIVGLLFATSSAFRSARTAPWKWVVVAMMAAVSLMALFLTADALQPLIGHSVLAALWLVFGVYGVLLLISGGISLVLYVRQYPAPREEA